MHQLSQYNIYYLYNYNLGKIIANVASQVIVVKKKKRLAILNGLIDSGFLEGNVKCVSSFLDAKEIIEGYGKDTVVLIENDLPDNYI